MNYYNEFDTKTAAWLRELINQGLIPKGDVDTRSITEVTPNELHKYTQCHFFAGIGGWSLALQLAGWDSSTPVWTGSCPCQPFSTAGKGLGDKDERHLWPVFFNLIKECRPEYVFGEQVASAIGKGWLDGISTDLGEEGYTCGSAVLGAHSVGAPHIRQRLYWVAYSDSGQCKELRPSRDIPGEQSVQPTPCDSASDGLGNPSSERHDRQHPLLRQEDGGRDTGDILQAARSCEAHWSNYTIIPCRDGKTRRIPTEPAFFPLAHGIPARVVRLRGYGNAIVPQAAAEFIQASTEETKIFTKSLDV